MDIIMQKHILIVLATLANAAFGQLQTETFGMNEEMLNAMSYLSQYHYIGVNNPDPRAAALIQKDPNEATRQGILLFQKMHNLTITGTLTQETRTLMATPRCGLPDVVDSEQYGEARRKKRYILRGGTWKNKVITYRISQYTQDNDLTPLQIDATLRRAFDVWEDVTPLRFIQKLPFDRVDIDIKFAGGEHGDGFAFDGRGSVLAHAFYPNFGGDTHFDEAEIWTIGTDRGTNLFQVAAHEFGHALGMAHSNNAISLMAPFYQGYQPNFLLPQDDLLGIQELYGQPEEDADDKHEEEGERTTKKTKITTITTTDRPTPSTKRPTPTSTRTTIKATTTTTTMLPTTTTSPRKPTTNSPAKQPEICEHPHFDAITTHLERNRKVTYAFKGRYYYKIKDNQIAYGYPRLIKQDWLGLPNDIDAALYWDAEYKTYWHWSTAKKNYIRSRKVVKAARTYLFKGSKYWRYENKRKLPGYPKPISAWGIPNDIDSAYVWSGNGMTYFTKGNKYYRYTRGKGLDRGYPRSLSAWRGLPYVLDAAFQHTDGTTYFFRGNKFYKFQDNYFKVHRNSPQQTAGGWLGCKTTVARHSQLVSAKSSSDKTIWCSLAMLISICVNLILVKC